MQRESERATLQCWRDVPRVPIAIILVFYCSVYVFTSYMSLLRQEGTLVNQACDEATTHVATGGCKYYELYDSPIGLPMKFSNMSALAVDYVQVSPKMTYTYDEKIMALIVYSAQSADVNWKTRVAPLGDFQTYSDARHWQAAAALAATGAHPRPFPVDCIGLRLRTSDYAMQPKVSDDSMFLALVEKLPQIIALFLISVLPPVFFRSQGKLSDAVSWHIILGFVWCFAGHGLLGGSFVLAVVTVNFSLARKFGRHPWALAIGWAFGVSFLLFAFNFLGPLDWWEDFCGDEKHRMWRYHGRCTALHRLLHNLTASPWPLLGFSGLCPWHAMRYVILRMIAFFVDHTYASRGTASLMNLAGKPDLITRQETNLPLEQYSYGLYVAYIFYPPLYWGGPIIGYNAFVSQLFSPQDTYSRRDIFAYGLRVFITIPILYLFLHFNYSTVLLYRSMPSPIVEDIGPFELYGLLHWMLQHEWLSLIVIWRFSRFTALLAGIDTPENMLLCVDANYRFETFWRIWHASLNRWALRNIYFPLGGNRRPFLAIPVIFAFIGLWHEITGFWTEPAWYIWAALNALGVIFEKAVSKINFQWPRPIFRQAAWGLNIILIIFANIPVLFFEKTPFVIRVVMSDVWRGSIFLLIATWTTYTCSVIVTDAIRSAKANPPRLQVLVAQDQEVALQSFSRERVGSINDSSFMGQEEAQARASVDSTILELPSTSTSFTTRTVSVKSNSAAP